MGKYFAGIGSRETPPTLRNKIQTICQDLISKQYTLRSGGADGADRFFEEAYIKYNGEMEIYLPWKNFNDNKSPLYNISPEAFEIAKEFHPKWNALSQGARQLHARNVYQVLGKDLMTPVEFVLYWTKDGKASGGTGQAMRIAKAYNINMYNVEDVGIF